MEQFLLVGLRREISPNGEFKAAYRKWYKEQIDEHDKMMFHLTEELSKRSQKSLSDTELPINLPHFSACPPDRRGYFLSLHSTIARGLLSLPRQYVV
jgi:hypothetical protein